MLSNIFEQVKKLSNTDELFDLLDFSERKASTKKKAAPATSSLVQHIISRVSDLGVDTVYFSGQFPTIYFKSVKGFDDSNQKTIKELHKKIWNERKVPFLYVSSPTELRIYNCFAEPINPKNKNQSVSELELFSYSLNSEEQKLEELLRVFNRVSIDSGLFWKEKKYAEKLDINRRVDKTLMRNLQSTRQILIRSGLSIDVVHDLLLRSLFILYLEDRDATTAEFYSKYLKDATSYFQILSSPEATYKLYDKLERSFNGNLCPVSQEEKENVSVEHLNYIKECFWSDWRSDNPQTVLWNWRVFDFSVIRIELISEIYEEFLSSEQGEEQTKKDGAYYTPHGLVDFILNERLPWADKNNKNYDLKILDPTCGSGIFLVESFKRVVDRWQYAHGKEVDFDTLKKLLLNSIYGIEVNNDAIKVAAFSLYLTLLDYLNPRTLWQDKRFPYLIYDPAVQDKTKQGKNLFKMSSLADGPFVSNKYDLIFGNPPFKRGGLDETDKKYLQKLGFAQEYVLAFLHRASELCPEGQITLVSASKILFNTTTGYQEFRNFLFNQNYVEAIYNFSALRKSKKEYGGSLFASAVGPACVIFYQKKKPKEANKNLLYCSPKSLLKSRMVDGVAIDTFDIKYIPREECSNPTSKIWKMAMWASERDFKLVKKLEQIGTLKTDLKAKKDSGWSWGNGFQTSQPNDKTSAEVSKLKLLETAYIDRYWVSKSVLTNNTPQKFRRLGDIKSYNAPHIVIKKGQKDKKFCAAYLDYSCAFRDGVYGISAPSSQANLLKAITAYINSSFASYYLFMTLSSLGVEREQIMLDEYLLLPSLPFRMKDADITRLSDLVDSIIDIKKQEIFISELSTFEKEIDEIIYSALNLSKKEKCLIEDSIKFGLDLFLEGDSADAYKRPTGQELERYGKQLCSELNDLLSISGNTTASVYYHEVLSKSPLAITAIKFFSKKKKATTEKVNYSNKINQLLQEIDDYTYQKHSESIYFRKVIKYYDQDIIYLIKPNEKRFWTRSSALTDADEIIMEVIDSAQNPS